MFKENKQVCVCVCSDTAGSGVEHAHYWLHPLGVWLVCAGAWNRGCGAVFQAQDGKLQLPVQKLQLPVQTTWGELHLPRLQHLKTFSPVLTPSLSFIYSVYIIQNKLQLSNIYIILSNMLPLSMVLILIRLFFSFQFNLSRLSRCILISF